MSSGEIDWGIEETDLINGKRLYRQDLLNEVNEERFFKKSVYWILSASNDYKNLRKSYEALEDRELLHPGDMKDNEDGVLEALEGKSQRNRFADLLSRFDDWWLESDFPEKVVKENGKTSASELRKEFVDATGIGPKTSTLSLINCGYKKLAPLDTHALQYLKKKWNSDIKVPHEERIRGLNLKQHEELEDEFIDMVESFSDENEELTERYEVSPAAFHYILWTRGSEYYTGQKSLDSDWGRQKCIYEFND